MTERIEKPVRNECGLFRMGKNMKTFIKNELDQKEANIIENLQRQVDSVFKHSHECSILTRRTYNERMDVFAKFLAVEYRKQNINKITNNHIAHYVRYLQDRGLSTSYVTTSLSAIRYFYGKSLGGRFIIKSNRAFEVNARSLNERIGKDRSISVSDYESLLARTIEFAPKEYEYALKCGLSFGLRIHEFFKMRRSEIKSALKTGNLMVKGKGGLVRVLPINQKQRVLLVEILNEVKSDNDRLFVKSDEKTHQKIKALEKYIRDSRDGTDKHYVYHSLRHCYAQNLHKKLINQGLSDYESRKLVSNRLGHNRVCVSDIYLEAYE